VQKHEGEREHGSWKEILWDLLIMLGLKEDAIKYSYIKVLLRLEDEPLESSHLSEIAEESERKKRRERNRSQRELELDKAE
jgi:hypothetical protein